MGHWLVAQFAEGEVMAEAAACLRAEGHVWLEAHSPYALPSAQHALPGRERIAMPTLLGALAGAVGGALVQWYCNAHDFPIDVGGRPLASVPAWVPISFEGAVLLGSFSALYAFLIACRLPRFDHPLQDSEVMQRATRDRFALSVFWALDSPGEPLARRLRELGATEVEVVGPEMATP